jgi:hypothetical protein
VSKRPVSGGGRRVEVGPERIGRWLAGFVERHGEAQGVRNDDLLVLAAADGAVAELAPPPGAEPAGTVADFVAAATRPRRIGLLLVRRGGIAVGVAAGERLESSKVDSAYVQSRTAAGGWSQQRFARRRENQAKALTGDAADLAVRLLLPAKDAGGGLAALVTGGDRRLVEAVLADPRLAALPAPARHLDVPDPRLAVLQAAVPAARAVRIVIRDPE